MSEGQYGNSNLPDFMVITDLGGEQHAIDRRSIITMTDAIPEDPPEGFVMGGKKVVTIIVNSPVGTISYYTGETLISLIMRVNKADAIEEYIYQRHYQSQYELQKESQGRQTPR